MWGLSNIAAAAAGLLRRMAGASRPGCFGRVDATAQKQKQRLLLAIQRERALADYAQAKRKHLAKRACSATHDLLRAEVGG